MAVKEKALRRLADKLNAAGILWAAGGDWLLVQKGLSTVWHSFELFVRPEDAEKADKVLTKLGMRSPAETDDAFACEYHFDGADITLRAGACFGGVRMRFDEASVAETVTVLGASVPLMHPEDWVVYTALSGKTEQAAALLGAMKEPDRSRFTACTEGELPGQAAALLGLA